MKKIYQKPELETAELHLHTAIMSGYVDNEKPQPEPTPEHGAPKRRVF